MSEGKHRATPATPEYAVGETVAYYDRQKRVQRGKVRRIEASWSGWGKGEPLIIYSLWHPTYHNNNCYAGVENILARAESSNA